MECNPRRKEVRIKKEYVAVILAALLGAIGFLGTGHFCAGRVRRG
jgi:TM2 domain-containing membrane protein YozV